MLSASPALQPIRRSFPPTTSAVCSTTPSGSMVPAPRYGPTEGYAPLREWVAERLRNRGVRVDPDEVMIVSGSQQGLDLVARLLHDGDAAMVEEPGYPERFPRLSGGRAHAVGGAA